MINKNQIILLVFLFIAIVIVASLLHLIKDDKGDFSGSINFNRNIDFNKANEQKENIIKSAETASNIQEKLTEQSDIEPMENMPEANSFKEAETNPYKEVYKNPFDEE